MSCMAQQSYAAQALDVALKHSTSMNPRAQAFARAFFWPDPDKVRPLGGGAEVVPIKVFGRALRVGPPLESQLSRCSPGWYIWH